MTTMILSGSVGANPVEKVVNGKNYYQISVAHKNGKEDTIWCRVMFLSYGQDVSRLEQGARVMVIGRPVFSCYEGRAQVTLWADKYEVQ